MKVIRTIKNLTCIIICFLLCFVSAQLINKNTIQDEIATIYNTELTLPVEQMKCYKEGHDTLLIDSTLYKYKIIVYFDSTSCSSCAYNNLHQWNSFINDINKDSIIAKFYFIFNPSKDNILSLKKVMLKQNTFNEPVYLDTIGVFKKVNTHIPSHRILHCLLLDENNHILLIGNPNGNKSIYNLYINTVTNKLKDL